jgi:hypothetical protein
MFARFESAQWSIRFIPSNETWGLYSGLQNNYQNKIE